METSPYQRNKHPEDQIKRLAKIMKKEGVTHSISITKGTNQICFGHGRKEAAILNKWTEFPIKYVEFDNEDQNYRMVQSDNAVAMWAELDFKAINLDLQNFGPFDIDLLGIKDFVVEPADKYGDQDADNVPEVRTTSIKLGDLFQLGNHRLLCGDATSKEDVERLLNGEKADMVFTDPPYGMNLHTDYDDMYAFGDDTHTGNRFKKIEGDNKKYDPAPILAIKAKRHFIWGCDYFYESLPAGGSIVAWDKRTESLDRVPGNTTEFCWSFPPVRRTTARILWSGHYGMNGDDKGSRIHPTQKPIKLHEWFFDKWGKDQINILDLYGGSGSTLIACEKQNKKCFMAEIDPQYIQVIIDRFEKFSNTKAVKIN